MESCPKESYLEEPYQLGGELHNLVVGLGKLKGLQQTAKIRTTPHSGSRIDFLSGSKSNQLHKGLIYRKKKEEVSIRDWSSTIRALFIISWSCHVSVSSELVLLQIVISSARPNKPSCLLLALTSFIFSLDLSMRSLLLFLLNGTGDTSGTLDNSETLSIPGIPEQPVDPYYPTAADNLCSQVKSNGLLPKVCSANGANNFENPNKFGPCPGEKTAKVSHKRQHPTGVSELISLSDWGDLLNTLAASAEDHQKNPLLGFISLLPKKALVLCRWNWFTWFCERVSWMYHIFLASFAKLWDRINKTVKGAEGPCFLRSFLLAYLINIGVIGNYIE